MGWGATMAPFLFTPSLFSEKLFPVPSDFTWDMFSNSLIIIVLGHSLENLSSKLKTNNLTPQNRQQ